MCVCVCVCVCVRAGVRACVCMHAHVYKICIFCYLLHEKEKVSRCVVTIFLVDYLLQREGLGCYLPRLTSPQLLMARFKPQTRQSFSELWGFQRCHGKHACTKLVILKLHLTTLYHPTEQCRVLVLTNSHRSEKPLENLFTVVASLACFT